MDKEKCPLCELGMNAWNHECKYTVGLVTGNEYDEDFEHEGVNLDLKKGRLYFDNSAGEYHRGFVLINYCPMCGRKLS